ncbi:unnamed protein product [Spirodela intermedia]|uniref:Uncharacterized protein n=1 Tax=Spirodela intermedia TaxID=51605 RepID=A0A7I8LG73_SPIIN|nr:unnamed protein product [Spirodela intermedia]
MENQSRQQFALALIGVSWTMTDVQQPGEGFWRLRLFELYLAFVYLTFTVVVVLSALSLRPPGEGAAPATAWIQKYAPSVALFSVTAAFVLRSCLILSPSSLLHVWFFLVPMALAVALLLHLAWNRWKDHTAVQNTGDESTSAGQCNVDRKVSTTQDRIRVSRTERRKIYWA